jgi:hypothetical protein
MKAPLVRFEGSGNGVHRLAGFALALDQVKRPVLAAFRLG